MRLLSIALAFPSGPPSRFDCEVVEEFGAASYETQHIEGHWREGGTTFRDNLVQLIIDVPDNDKNRRWMKRFKQR